MRSKAQSKFKQTCHTGKRKYLGSSNRNLEVQRNKLMIWSKTDLYILSPETHSSLVTMIRITTIPNLTNP